MPEPIHLAANNPDLGGGEQVLVRCAAALVALGRRVVVVAPDRPTDVLDAAAARRRRGRRDPRRRPPRLPPPAPRVGPHASATGCCGATGWCPRSPRPVTAAASSTSTSCPARAPSAPRWQSRGSGPRGVLAPSHFLASQVARRRGPRQLDRRPSSPTARGEAAPPASASWAGSPPTRASTSSHVPSPRPGSPTPPSSSPATTAGSPAEQQAPVARRARRARRPRTPPGPADARRPSSPTSTWRCSRAGSPSRSASSSPRRWPPACPSSSPTPGALPEVAGPDHPWVARAGDADDLAARHRARARRHPGGGARRDRTCAPALGG